MKMDAYKSKIPILTPTTQYIKQESGNKQFLHDSPKTKR